MFRNSGLKTDRQSTVCTLDKYMIKNECSGLKAGDKDILVATDVAGRGQNHCHNCFNYIFLQYYHEIIIYQGQILRRKNI
jgi:hypothetical protein